MRNKINIIYERKDIADEELERFKNFDSLLSRHYRILNDKKPVTWKIVIPAIILVGSIVFYWFSTDDNSTPVENPAPSADSVGMLEQHKSDDKTQAASTDEGNVKSEIAERSKANLTKTEDRDTPPLSEQKIDSVSTKESQPDSTSAVFPTDKPKSDTPLKTEAVYMQAEPIDGYEALYAYFRRELIYPEGAVKDSVEGVLIVKFLINKDGKPEKIQTSGLLGILFDKEAVRLIENMPLWKPATLNGKPVISKLSIPLTFQLQKK